MFCGPHRQSLVHKTYCFPRSQSISVNCQSKILKKFPSRYFQIADQPGRRALQNCSRMQLFRTQHGTRHPNMILPNTKQRNWILPNIKQPDMILPNVKQPNTILPNTKQPNRILPNIKQPNTILPNIKLDNVIILNCIMRY